MKGICVIGRKGGTGKSTLSHAIGFGATLLGIPAYVVHTDNQSFPENADSRPYALLDGRTPESLMQWINSAADKDHGILVIDGAAGRGDLDIKIAEFMDLALIPVTASGSAVDEAIRQGERVPSAKFVLNEYPTNKFRRAYITNRYYKRLPQDRIMCHVANVSSADQLTDLYGSFDPSTRTRSLAKSAFINVCEQPEINLDVLQMRRAVNS